MPAAWNILKKFFFDKIPDIADPYQERIVKLGIYRFRVWPLRNDGVGYVGWGTQIDTALESRGLSVALLCFWPSFPSQTDQPGCFMISAQVRKNPEDGPLPLCIGGSGIEIRPGADNKLMTVIWQTVGNLMMRLNPQPGHK